MYLAENQLENYLKYSTFHLEQTKKYQADRFKAENLPDDVLHHRFHCPNGQFLIYQETRSYTTDNGCHGKHDIYECQDCRQCQYKSDCTRAQGNRQFRWFLLRGLEKVTTACGLLSIAHDMLKLAAVS